MTQEEKQLILKDLCGRLPYGVIVNNPMTSDDDVLTYSLLEDCEAVNTDYPKPYLRLMSSMTEEEMKDYRMFIDYSYNDFTSESTPCVYTNKVNDYIDWLNEHHFDYRGLIEKGLALKAPDGMYGKI